MAADSGDDNQHEAAVYNSVQAAVRAGFTGLNDVLQQCEGADPVLVSKLLAKVSKEKAAQLTASLPAYDVLSVLSRQLPAPDPSRSQWWFSSSGLMHLLSLIASRISHYASPRVLCLGTPTLGPHLAHQNINVNILDIDDEVLRALEPLGSSARTTTYDVADALPQDLRTSFQISILDPPWYKEAIYNFLNRALEATAVSGEILCTLPGRLTRPGIESLRVDLIRELVKAGHEVLAVERGTVQYQVPRFELAALERLEGFRGIPWRAGDLLHLRKGSANAITVAPLTKSSCRSFARRASEFRIFSHTTAQANGVIAKKLPAYSANISTRAHPDEDADVWSSEKVGIQTGNIDAIHAALESWAAGKSKTDTNENLVKQDVSRDYASDVVDSLEGVFGLWSKFAAEPPLRLDKKIEDARIAALSHWATQPGSREHKEPDDPFRGHYQRDRDRILWSSGLRRLSNKTQLFPVEHDDDLRQRLAHSIEVFQLASTIGISFGLDDVLIEAGALAHDIGHTPFGHAGEHALDKLLNVVSKELGGFNHYEHGVDVLRYLEGPYHASPATPFAGLNLTPEVSECVLKHTYCHGGNSFASEELLARSKHSDVIQCGYCHLEGQAVRAADKISYLISDIEDGIRLQALSRSDLLSCRFFHRPPLDFSGQSGASLSEQFAEQRRWVLKILMEDVLQASSKRLARFTPSLAEIRGADSYLIQHSEEMLADMEEIWSKLQAGRLHADKRVVSANLKAAKIVGELAIAFSVLPDLIEERFRLEHERLNGGRYMEWYRKKVGRKVTLRSGLLTFLPMHVMIGKSHNLGDEITIDVEQLVMAKDYVAALSDSRARLFHRQIIDGR